MNMIIYLQHTHEASSVFENQIKHISLLAILGVQISVSVALITIMTH